LPHDVKATFPLIPCVGENYRFLSTIEAGQIHQIAEALPIKLFGSWQSDNHHPAGYTSWRIFGLGPDFKYRDADHKAQRAALVYGERVGFPTARRIALPAVEWIDDGHDWG